MRVSHQGSCGSCWAHTTVAIAEKKYFQIYGKQVDLSQQELVDCDTANSGCSGGWPIRAAFYINNNGISLISGYPYRAQQGTCSPSLATSKVLKGKLEPRENPFSLANARALISRGQWASTYVYAMGQFRFLSKSNDVFDMRGNSECNTNIDHVVTVVNADADTITILNTWGTTWGYLGTKRIRPCAADKFWGSMNFLTTV